MATDDAALLLIVPLEQKYYDKKRFETLDIFQERKSYVTVW